MNQTANWILGIDTSNYKTSVAVVDSEKKILCDLRKLLRVKQGERGLRQSDALFQHLENPVSYTHLDVYKRQLLDYSYYAYEEELAKGYITIEGGHRVGICGRAVLDHGKVTLIKEVSSLNLRRSREITGVSERILSHVLDKEGRLQNTLIVSPPKCGKTTLLRDLMRALSYQGFKIGLCDDCLLYTSRCV